MDPEVLADERLVELSPYPTSRVGAAGFIGRSDAARRVLVVIAYRDLDGDLHGMNAWRPGATWPSTTRR